MAKLPLIPFKTLDKKSFEFNVEINRNQQAYFISFFLQGDLSLINFGPTTPQKERRIALWEKTCFELFIKNNRDEYLEFNFSPQFEWNCFYFKKKGDSLAEWLKMPRPETDILLSLDRFFLIAEIKKEFFPDNFITEKMSVGISSVIQFTDEQMSYWALSHQDSKPNFHHFDSFIYKF